MTSVVGWRIRPDGRTWHAGLDLAGGVGTPVHAVRDGLCVISVPDNSPGFGGYGVSVVLWHEEDGVFSHYAHLSRRHVERGVRVRHGEVIAEVGRTSSGTWPNMGAHLHFELRRQIPAAQRANLRARTLRHEGRVLVEGSPYPGPYSHPTRELERFGAVWVNPLEWLAGFGIQGPPLPWGQSGVRFDIVRGSAADCDPSRVAEAPREPVGVPRQDATYEEPISERPVRLPDVEPRASVFDGLPFDAGHDEDEGSVREAVQEAASGQRASLVPVAVGVAVVAALGVAVAAGRARG
ncbi:MAG: M23 family metallopeptidase [Kofleriaceae bacterium]|nr:M23 family metallopeptidase [Kofleriaceae bacterium]